MSSKSLPDAYLDYSSNTLYVFFSESSSSTLWRFSYDAPNRSWTKIDENAVPTVRNVSGDPASFIKAKNGDLWAFMANDNQVYAVHSTDEGASWSTIIIANNLTGGYGLTDAATFTDNNGRNYLGVGVGEDTDVTARFHFYIHREGDSDTIWVDESNQVSPLESEQADDHINLAVDRFNNVYMVTKNHGTGPSNSLYVRHPDSTWSAYPLNNVDSWTRPAVVVDNSNDSLFVLGSRTGDRAELKKCKIGEEATLVNDSLRVVLMSEGGDYFVNLSVSFHAVYDSTEFMAIADNSDKGDVWFSWLAIGASSGCPIHPQPIDTTIYNMNITRSGTDVILDWTAVAEADSYVVYRGLTPMFSADTARLAMVLTNTYTDAGALGDPSVNHFYRVRAYVNGGAGPLGARVGEFEYRLLAPADLKNNFIALSLKDPGISVASDFVTRVGPTVDLVSKWVDSTQSWVSYVPGLAFTDYPVQVNEVYMISVTTEDTLELVGEVPIGFQYNLITTSTGKNNNGMMLLMDADSIKTASELATSIGPVELVSRWNTAAQAWVSYVPGLSFTDFAVTFGQPLLVSVTADTTWPQR